MLTLVTVSYTPKNIKITLLFLIVYKCQNYKNVSWLTVCLRSYLETASGSKSFVAFKSSKTKLGHKASLLLL